MTQHGTTALFLFDYTAMDTSYGYCRQAFEAIYDCLKTSAGVCAFNDGDIAFSETLRQLFDASRMIKSAGDKSVLTTREFSSIRPYVAAMWTDKSQNVTTLHNYLLTRAVPGYHGFMQLDISSGYEEFLRFCNHSLGLPQSICLRDGDIIKGTAKYGIGVKSGDAKLLHAASYGDFAEAEKAIRDGADVECVDSHDHVSTPLFHAASGGHADVVRLLLKHGANPNTNNGANTALMIASRFGHVEVVKALIENGVNVDETDRDGCTAFDKAKDQPAVLELLRSASEPIQQLNWGITGVKPSPGRKAQEAGEKEDKVIIETRLKAFEFEVVTVNARGQVVKKESKQAQYFTEDLGNDVTLDMVAVPGGTFMMGTEDEEIERLNKEHQMPDLFSCEKPQHRVTVPPFFMGKYPVTQAQWRAIASRTDLKEERDLKADPSYFKGDDRPVEGVNWYHANEFCARLSKLTGREYRLPSEAEWEYACRAGTTTPFHFGETISTDRANYGSLYTHVYETKGVYRQQTTEVGIFPPNAFGLYDMHGNVREWCADTWHENYDGAPTDGSVWTRDGYDHHTTLRGGSWCSDPNSCRSASRSLNIHGHGSLNFSHGFRVVCGDGRTL